MKKIVLGFLQKGLVACGFGPMVLVILYWILHRQCDLQYLSVNEVCTGIISLSVLAFIAGGMNVIYRIERLPLAFAILIHGSVLYISYLCTYLVNRWLEWGKAPVIVFTVIFVLGYLMIWAIIYWTTQKRTARLNEMLKQKQNNV